MKAHLDDGDVRVGRERQKPAAEQRTGLSSQAGLILSLQRAAGNQAVSGLVGLAGASVQRCGADGCCDCASPEQDAAADPLDQGQAPVQRAATPSEFAIKGKFPGAAGVANSIFFDINETAPDAAEAAKIAPLASASASAPLTLKGTASEEGGAGLNASIVNSRITNVSKALAGAGHAGSRTPEAVPLAGVGNIDYRRARSVEVRTTGAPSATPDCSLGSQPTDGGPPPNNFTTALARAHAMIAIAKTKLATAQTAAADPHTVDTLIKLYGDTTVSAVVSANLNKIDGQLTNMVPFTPTHGHQVVNICDASCASGADAYNHGAGAGAMMTLCPSFMSNGNLDERAAMLIHEGSHGTDGLETEDNAYQFQRLITKLPQDRALNNADTYAAVVQDAVSPGSVNFGPAVGDVHAGGMTPAEEKSVDLAVAWLEQWLVGTLNDTSSCYGVINESIPKKAWTEKYYEEVMGLIAPTFGLTVPPAVPTEKDKVAVAGVNDRIQSLSNSLQSGPLTLEKVAEAGTTWSAGPGTGVKIGTAFFGLTARQQTETLLGKIVASLPAIPASRRADYTKFVIDNVKHGDLGSP